MGTTAHISGKTNVSRTAWQGLRILCAVAAGLLFASCSMASLAGGGGASAKGLVLSAASPSSGALDRAILARLTSIRTFASTVPGNGDVNPYGVALVKRSVGKLRQGSILVSNFNNSANEQGTGTTIVQVARGGSVSQFAALDASSPSFPGGVGLTTALVELSAGWVIVGSLPTADGTAPTATAGTLIVLDSMGNVAETISGPLINGPWDMTAWERDGQAKLFVTNVLNGTVAAGGATVNEGTVVRVDLDISKSKPPKVEAMTVIASGFPERTDPAALVIGPTGVALGLTRAGTGDDDATSSKDNDHLVLYVADSLDNAIAAVPNPIGRTTSAGTGSTLSSGGSLNDPLGLIVAPNGHILTVNGNDGFITEITPSGTQVAKDLLDNTGTPPGAGALFGLAFDPGRGVFFVDDATNTLNLLH